MQNKLEAQKIRYVSLQSEGLNAHYVSVHLKKIVNN